jgi:D-alanyl-D-alanine endopeptidase (penicillin-binding protein 7)
MWSKRTIDFVSSFGVMLLGVTGLLLGSVLVTHDEVSPIVDRLPLSEERIVANIGSERARLFPISRPVIPTLRHAATFTEPLTAESALVVDDRTNAVLFKKNSGDIRSLASITKLMSALVLVEVLPRFTSTTVLLETDIEEDRHLEAGESYPLEALWNMALINSSNSAINALVRSTGLTEEQFVARMNAKAQELGVYTMRFVEPTGLDGRNMGSAIDVAKLLKFALQNQKISKTLGQGEYTARPLNSKNTHRVWSTNWLLTNWIPNVFDKEIMVGKTGFITDSGYNFVVRLAGKHGEMVRVAVMGASSNELRFAEARDLATWVIANYQWPAIEAVSASAP